MTLLSKIKNLANKAKKLVQSVFKDIEQKKSELLSQEGLQHYSPKVGKSLVGYKANRLAQMKIRAK